MPRATRKCPDIEPGHPQCQATPSTRPPPNTRPTSPTEPGQRPPQNQANVPHRTRPTSPTEPGQRPPQNQANVPHRTRPTNRTPKDRGPRGGFRGVVPPGRRREPSRSRPEGGEHRATPGGYGGKPPGVAIIGVPTGARNAGSGAPTGDQSTDMNVTRKRPRLCQDPITTESRDGAEQANHERDKLSLERGRAGWPFPPVASGGTVRSRVAGTFGLYSMKPRVLSGSRPPLANTTAK